MDCRCTEATEFYGNEASSYASGHLVRDETIEDELRVTYTCPDTGRRWEMDFPPDEPEGDPGDARLRQIER